MGAVLDILRGVIGNHLVQDRDIGLVPEIADKFDHQFAYLKLLNGKKSQ